MKAKLKSKISAKNKTSNKKSKRVKEEDIDIAKSVLAGRKLPLWGVKECRAQFDCGDAEAHLQHLIISLCCDAPCTAHFSKGELVILCLECAKPSFRIQVAYNVPKHIKEA